jgi:hypothetical protein
MQGTPAGEAACDNLRHSNITIFAMRYAIIPVTPVRAELHHLLVRENPQGRGHRSRAARSSASRKNSMMSKLSLAKILVTHGHIDHAGGVAALAERHRRADRGAARGRSFLD